MDKELLRKEFRKKRSELSNVEVREKSYKIAQNFIENLLPKLKVKEGRVFSLYKSAYNEVETDVIANFFAKKNIKFSYPKITAKDKPLQFILKENDSEFVSNKDYPDILEIQKGIKTVPKCIILPLLSFDSKKNRLGMGGGFFDRTINALRAFNSNIITIALAYDFQEFDGVLPVEKFDQKVNFIVSESTIIS